MSLHDAYARITPFEIAFRELDPVQALVAAVSEESSRRSVDPADLDGFLGLAVVGDFLVELHGEETPRVDLIQHGTFAFHAMHFVGAGSKVFLMSAPAARRLVEAAPQAEPVSPMEAGYLQLPQHLFWARVEGASPESVDGAFWTVSAAGRLHVLPITGVRADRPGFGTLAVPNAPLAHAGEWLHATARPDGKDYQSDLPGAQLDGLYAIESVGEILKLMARFFAHVAGHPGTAGHAPEAVPAGAPRPSALPFIRIDLD